MPSHTGELPTVASYLRSLPGGIDAHPSCMVKGSLLRDLLIDPKVGPNLPLPPVVNALVIHPPPVSMWIPEVHFNVLMLTVYDVHYGASDVRGYWMWVYDRNRQLLSTMLYRALFHVLSPERLLSGVERRWAVFRRGTQMRYERRGEHDIELYVESPPYLYPLTVLHGMTAALHSLMDMAGGTQVQVTGKLHSPCEVIYRVTWA